MEIRWYFFFPIAPILVILLIVILLGGVAITAVGQWIYTSRWYIFGFFCLLTLINGIAILRASDIICAISFLVLAAPVLYYILNRSVLLAIDGISLNLDYILCVIAYVAFTIILSFVAFCLSYTFLDDEYTYSITDNYRESIKYFLQTTAVSAVIWGFNAFVFYVVVPIYSFD